MNPTIELLLKHRSIRKFKNEPVTDEQFAAIIRAAQSASTSSNMQAYSVIRVNDPVKKKRLAEAAGGQPYVEENPLLLVWCADLYRLRMARGMHGDINEEALATTENLLVATVDAALAAQNAAVAAESLGLGIVYIGGIRNQPEIVTELLELPLHVYPVFGMCIGIPDQQPMPRPRLPQEAIVHADRYDPAAYPDALSRYDAEMKAYMLERTGGKRDHAWTEDMAAKLAQPNRAYMKAYLAKQRFGLL